MKRKNLFLISALTVTAAAVSACSTATAPAESNNNSNVAVLQNDINPIANVPPSTPAANSAVPGIPNAPANMNISKADPTRNANVQSSVVASAPDNSEITVSLGQFPVETRTFKNHPQLAKVEKIQDVPNKKNVVKVYLRNGQVKQLPDNITLEPLSAPAASILQAAQEAPAAKPEPKMENPPLPAPQSEQRLQKPGVPQKNQ